MTSSNLTDSENKLRKSIIKYWTNFAKTGYVIVSVSLHDGIDIEIPIYYN